MAKPREATSKRIASTSAPAGSDAQEPSDALVEQIRREINAVVRPLVDNKAPAIISTSCPPQEAGFFGSTAEKLSPILARLMQLNASQMSDAKKADILLSFGDMLSEVREYRAASSFFYRRALGLVGTATPNEDFDIQASFPSFPTNRRGHVYVRSIFGVAMCAAAVERSSDPHVRHPGTLERLVGALQMLQRGMQAAVTLETQYRDQFSWLLLNGSLSIFAVAKPLATLGFSKEVVGYFKWCLLALESTVTLCTVRFVEWRLRLCIAICDCFDTLAHKQISHREAHLKASLRCAEYALKFVQRLQKEEGLEMPVPVETQQTLAHALSTATMLVMRAKVASTQSFLSKSAIEAAFSTPSERVRIAMDAMEQISRSSQLSHSASAYLSSFPVEQASAMSELLSTVVETVSPLFASDSTTSSVNESLPGVFPMAFHLAAIRYSYRLGTSHRDRFLLLAKAVRERIANPAESIAGEDGAMISHLISIFDALDAFRQFDGEDSGEEGGVQSGKPIKLTSGRQLAPEKCILSLVDALQRGVLVSTDAFGVATRDLLVAAALLLWKDVAQPTLQDLEATDSVELSIAHTTLACSVLQAIHLLFTTTDFDDILLHGQVALNVGTLLVLQQRPRVACQVVRRCLSRINAYRDELALPRSHFACVADQRLPDTPETNRGLGDATFSCSLADPTGTAEAKSSTTEHSASDEIGVHGTGAQFGRVHQDLCCVQVDLQLLLFRAELEDASTVDMLQPLTLKSDKSDNRMGMYLQDAETNLSAQCRQNGYSKALLSIQQLRHASTAAPSTQMKLVDDSFKALRRMESHERKLQRLLSNKGDKPIAEAEGTTTATPATATTVPVAPIVVARSSTAVTVKVIEFVASIPVQRRRPIQYYMVYGKPAGAGTDVSLTNNQLPGTATPIFPPDHTVTISGLTPNESYVFAVAAYDNSCELIQSIGETSEPVIALNPLPLPLCYGYLAQACQRLDLGEPARKAATYLYNLVVSAKCARRHVWKASPFYRQALKRQVVLNLPTPILNQCVAAMQILSHDESGDPVQEGMLLSGDLDGRSLLASHIAIMESARRISMGVEIAAAAENWEAVQQLCYKGYRVLLPLLHLSSGCGGMAFPPLLTLFQGLASFEHESCGPEVRSIVARFGYELYRIAARRRESEVSVLTLPIVSAAAAKAYGNVSLVELKEVLALDHLFKSRNNVNTSRVDESPASTASTGGPGGAKGASKASSAAASKSTGGPEADEGEAGSKLPPLHELVETMVSDAPKVFKTIESQSHLDKRSVEFACKIANVLLQGASVSTANNIGRFLSTIKVAGDYSEGFREMLKTVGGGSMLPKETPSDDAGSATPDAPGSARSVPPSSPRAGDEPGQATNDQQLEEPVEASDDQYLYQWCGELFFLQAVALARTMVELRSHLVDSSHGPATEDCIFNMLNSSPAEIAPVSVETTDAPSIDAPQTGDSDNALDKTTEPIDHERFTAALEGYIKKIAASVRLFEQAQCWQSLQAAMQHMWNTLWREWIPPNQIAKSPTQLAHLAACTDALLNLVESAVSRQSGNATDGDSGTHKVSITEPGQTPAVQSTIVVTTAMSTLRVHPAWLATLVTYTVRVLVCARDWQRIVQTGERYHVVCGSTRDGTRFAELNFPILIHAQQQILKSQDELVTAAQAERQAFTTAFQEQEAKKKKKKSRLVVEEVATPEEVEFRARDVELQQNIQTLTASRDHERSELDHLTRIFDGLQKNRNKCQQALDTCHELVRDYRRRQSRDDQGATSRREELNALRKQVVAAFARCIASCRQKKQKRLACQALQELGDFHLACGQRGDAVRSWHEALDNAFSTLDITTMWRQAVSDSDNDSVNGDVDAGKIAGEELWVAMLSCSSLSKLILHSCAVTGHEAVEFALMAAAVLTRLYACALPHPAKRFLYGSYQVLGQLWPGRELLLDCESVSPFAVALMLVVIQDALLQYEGNHAVASMPVIAVYECIASRSLEDLNHIGNAVRHRIAALTFAGRYQEAFVQLDRMMQPQSGTEFTSSIPVFLDNKGLQSQENLAAMTWISTLDVTKLAADLTSVGYHAALTRYMLLTVLRLAVALAILPSHPDDQAATLRTAVQTMAKSVFESLSTDNDASAPEAKSDEQQQQDSQPVTTDGWDELEIRQLRCNVILQQSDLYFSSGRWNTAIEVCEQATHEFDAVDTHLVENSKAMFGMSSVDQQLKYSLVNQRSTLLAKCRRRIVACHVARGDLHAAVSAAEFGICEARGAGEEILCSELELQRLQALACLGKRDEAESGLTALERNMVSHHAASRSHVYIRVMHTLGSLMRSKAAFKSDASHLEVAYRHLSAAKCEVDELLRAEGWIGVGIDHDEGKENREKRIKLYHPALPTFVEVSADLARAMVEYPADGSSGDGSEFATGNRGHQALNLIRDALRALAHTTARMSSVRARLLLLQGAILKKKLVAAGASSLSSQEVEEHFVECVDSLEHSIRVSIVDGGHDRSLIRSALIELVDLYTTALLPERKDEHVQAAFHFLSLAVRVFQQESVLFDSVELQAGAQMTLPTTFPAHITEAITSGKKDDDPKVVVPPRPNPTPADTKKAAASASAPAVPGTPVSAGNIINFFIRTLREQRLLPMANTLLQDTTQRLHSFLLQNHATYAKACCLVDLPAVPSLAPEILPGSVCAHWGRDITPGICGQPDSTEATTRSQHVTLFFILGTAKVDTITEPPVSARENGQETVTERMERFLSTPLLSKRAGLSRIAIHEVRLQLSQLRVDMEDEQSLVIDKTAFGSRLVDVMLQAQSILRKTSSSATNVSNANEEQLAQSNTSSVCDMFGNRIAITPTLELVKALECLFTITKAISIADNTLCYFLRDLLD